MYLVAQGPKGLLLCVQCLQLAAHCYVAEYKSSMLWMHTGEHPADRGCDNTVPLLDGARQVVALDPPHSQHQGREGEGTGKLLLSYSVTKAELLL